MITKLTGYQSSDGTVHGSLTGAKAAEIKILFHDQYKETGIENRPWTVDEIASFIVGREDRILDILTMKSSSKPRARKINGGTKTRAPKVKPRHEAEQFPLPMEDNTKPAA